jgi:hypothetical protein
MSAVRRHEKSSILMSDQTTEEQHRYVYRHVQFNHAIRTPGQLLAEHGDSRWELVRIVPYDGYESILVLRSAE